MTDKISEVGVHIWEKGGQGENSRNSSACGEWEEEAGPSEETEKEGSQVEGGIWASEESLSEEQE